MRTRPLVLGLAVLCLAAPTGVAAAETDEAQVSTQVVESFDGTPIVSTLFLPPGASPDAPVPLVLRTHGWGGTGETEANGTLEVLLDHGYAVMTWDQRGFGCSGGTVRIDKPEFEGRDASALIDWAVANAPIATVDGDPLVGFTGGSYAGGIQTATASIDPRVDAIAPEILWDDLRYSLYAGEVVNQGWASVLYAAGLATAETLGLDPNCPAGPQSGGLDPLITQGFAEGATSGVISDEVLDFFAASSLAAYGQQDPVAIPTLVLQGSVDTLFDLTDGFRVFDHVRRQGAPARLVAFCGGHVACPASYAEMDDRAHLDEAIIAWFDRHLRGDTSVDTGPPVEYRTNEGQWRTASDFPPADFGTLEATGDASLVSIPALDTPDPSEVQAYVEALDGGGIPGLPLTVAQPANPAELANGQAATVEITAAEGGSIELLGIPQVTLTVTGTGPEVILFAKLVDRETGETVNLQEGAVRVPLGEQATTVEVPMPGMAYTLPEGHHLDLQVSTASLMHSNARTPAQADVQVTASIPARLPAPVDPPAGDDPPAGADAPGDGQAPPAAAEPPAEEPAPAPAASVAADQATLPATGGALPMLAPLAMLALAAVARRR